MNIEKEYIGILRGDKNKNIWNLKICDNIENKIVVITDFHDLKTSIYNYRYIITKYYSYFDHEVVPLYYYKSIDQNFVLEKYISKLEKNILKRENSFFKIFFENELSIPLLLSFIGVIVLTILNIYLCL